MYKRTLFKYYIVYLFYSLFFAPLYAQQTKVTIDKKDITLNEFLTEIRKQTGYDFVFTSSKLDFNKRISPKFKNESVVKVLSEYFNVNTGVIYILKNKTIVLIDEDKAENKVVQGTVVNEGTGTPIVGAIVGIQEKKIETRTDRQGSFVFNVPEYAQSLEVRSMGFETAIVPITASVKYDIQLSEKTESIEDVVVTGIFNRSAESFTGASKTIAGDEIKKINTNSVFAAVAALDPAFRIVPNNASGGDLNQMPEIRMRGENSFPNLTGELSNNPNQPLFILDGFEVSLQRIVDLDMNLIKSITLLKDASATAIYGSRGANGVMVVATIPPQPGKIQVTFTNDFRLTTPELSVYDLLNAREKLDFEQRVGIYTSTSASTQYTRDVLYNERYKLMLQGADTDWLSLPTQTGYSNRSSLRLQGGDQVFRYGLQFTTDLQEGVMKGQDRNNYSGQVDLSYLVKKFRFSNSLRVFQNKANVSPYGSFSQYVAANPYNSPYDQRGNIQQYLEDFLIDGSNYRRTNPMYNSSLHSVNSSEYFGVTNNFSARYNILPFLFLESSFSISKQTDGSDQFFSAQDTRFLNQADLSRRGSYTARSGDSFSYESMSTANLNLKRGKNQLLSTLGFNFASNRSEYYRMVAEGFPYDQLDNLLFAMQYETNGRPTGDESTVNRVGFVYNGNYSFDNRFLADVSIRRDGSSQYGTNRRFGTFWSTGIGWNLHNEQFIQDLGFVDRFRLRTTYGATGSLNIPAYASQFRYNFGTSSSYYDELGATLANLGNLDLSWQSVYKLNLGLDLTLLRERLDMGIDLYQEDTKNALTTITLAPSTGFTSFSENLGALRNTGLEFSARYVLVKNPGKGLLWSVNVNGFTNKNILKEISNKLRSANSDLDEANAAQVVPNTLLQEGESVNTIYAVRSLGVDPATGSEVFLNRNGEMTFVWDAADKVSVGINQPKWNGNFGTNLTFKGFELNMIFNYQFGGQIYNQTLINRVESVNPNENVDRRAYDLGWTGPGSVSQYTRITTSSVPTRLTSRFVQDERNLRLTSASVGYNFYKSNLIKRLGARSLQITASTNDILWLSSVQIERGTDNPFARNYALSLRVGF